MRVGERGMDEAQRLDLIRAIEGKRGARVISYITAARPGLGMVQSIQLKDVRVLERHIRAAMGEGAQAIDLFISTPGGLAVVPWRLVSLFREYLKGGRFAVLVPSMALSAGTKIALGADEIVMTPGGELGPIDTQVGGLGVEDIRNYLEVADTLNLSSEKARLRVFELLAQELSPSFLGDIQRMVKEGERVALHLLEHRRKPLSAQQNKKIATFLLNQIGLHGQSIRRTEARKAGIDFVMDAERFEIADEMAQLFDAYEHLMDLDVPFARARSPQSWRRGDGRQVGDAEDFDVRGLHVMDRPVAVIESRARLDIGVAAYGHRFWRDAPERPEPPPKEKEPHRAPIIPEADKQPYATTEWLEIAGGAHSARQSKDNPWNA